EWITVIYQRSAQPLTHNSWLALNAEQCSRFGTKRRQLAQLLRRQIRPVFYPGIRPIEPISSGRRVAEALIGHGYKVAVEREKLAVGLTILFQTIDGLLV